MEKSLKAKKFQTLLKVLNVLFSLLLILTGIGNLLILLFLGGTLFTSESFIQNLINQGSISASIGFNGLKIFMEETTFHYDKTLMIISVLLALLYGCVIFAILLLVKRFIQSIINGGIFTLKNSRRIEWIAYCILFLSVTIKGIAAYFLYSMNEMVQLADLLQEVEWVESVSFEFFGIHWSMLLCGLVIWTIGYIFRYGTFLQEEYDATV